MSNDATPHPIIDRQHGSEIKNPEAAIAATEVGHETVYIGKLTGKEGQVAHLRVGRAGYRLLFKNKLDGWFPVHNHNNVHGVALGTGAMGTLGDLAVKLHALGFEPTEDTIDFIDAIPGSAAAAYSAARAQRSVVAADYLPPQVQALRDYSAGASVFRGY
ncbi:MAG: hypothetical protein HRT82_17155 [Henriciella sp.]|nr:hypothetical protein [Henriciella sp.]